MRLKYCCILFLFLISCHLQASDIDSLYIRPFDQAFSIRAFVVDKYMEIEYYYDSKRDLEYKANNPVAVGLGFTWGNTTISGSYGFDFMRNKKKGKTRSFDLQYHHFSQKYLVDIYAQRYKGFYLDEGNLSGIGITVADMAPDLKFERYGASAQYVFNNRKFSHKAVFDYTEEQLKSAGSFLLGGNVFYSKLRSDSSLIDFGKYKQKNLQIGVSGGYAHTWVLKRHFFITGSITFALNVGSDYISDFYKHKVEVTPSIFPRLALGYNADRWMVNVAIMNHTSMLTNNKDKMLSSSSGSVQLTYVRRIDFYNKLLDLIPGSR